MGKSECNAGGMTAVTHPVLNNPWKIPGKFWNLDKNFRATDELKVGRRKSGAYMSVPRPVAQRGGVPMRSAEDIAPHPQINAIREEVGTWRECGWQGASPVTRELLDHWTGGKIEPRPFFCQLEAVETLVWLCEAGPKLQTDAFLKIREKLDSINESRNAGIDRLGLKMATGTGKTLVMAMIMLWQTMLRSGRSDFLILVPNLTVQARLTELIPDPSSPLYKNLCPHRRTLALGRMHVTILNFQALQRRSTLTVDGENDIATGAAKKLLKGHLSKDPEGWIETPQAMFERLLRNHRGAKRVTVLNDEAHHCYGPEEPPANSRPDAEIRNFEKHAALWFGGIKALRDLGRLGQVFDLSATPMYIRKPVDLESELFPWTVSDYPLIEAVEAGLTKIPMVPIGDDTESLEPVYRNTFKHTPNAKSLNPDAMPPQVTDLLEQMHEKYQDLAEICAMREGAITPVMIVVANSIHNADALYRHIAGFREKNGIWHPGAYPMFSNVRVDGAGPVERPPTMLAHSALDETGSGARPGDRVETLQSDVHEIPDGTTKEGRREHFRKMFNTVGQPGEPGEHIRCVVSVSMLTEGWDVRTVTHIFGFRAFTSQLLCEQVAGRALRRSGGFAPAADGLLKPEYASIFGVPFNFMSGGIVPPQPPPLQWRVETVPGRKSRRITFPNVCAYALDPPELACRLDPDLVDEYEVTPAYIPGTTIGEGLVGDGFETGPVPKRRQRILYKIARDAVSLFCKANAERLKFTRRRVLFASMLRATEEWLCHPGVSCLQHELLAHPPHFTNVPVEIARACVPVDGEPQRIRPVFADEQDRQQPRTTDTSEISFETALRSRYPLETARITANSEINRAACHSESEARLAAELDRHPDILAWARNFRMGWQIPWLDREAGVWRFYEPDFVARLAGNDAEAEPRHLVIEFKGVPDAASAAKENAVGNWWLPAVNGSSDPACRGRWAYWLVDDRQNLEQKLGAAISDFDLLAKGDGQIGQ